LVNVDLDTLERDGIMAHPAVAELVRAASVLCLALEKTNPIPDTIIKHARMTRTYLDVKRALKKFEVVK
jgi:hypothetical protein